MDVTKDSLLHSTYYAPRGRDRLKELARRVSQRYLSLDDRLIGFVGGPGAGKSVFIEGLFPRLLLTNDDDGINVRPLPLMEDYKQGYFKQHTYHVDVQFEAAFLSKWELAKAMRLCLAHKKRLVVEHFDKIYKHLEINAQLLIGIGEEVIITRPNVIGPNPLSLFNLVEESIIYRKMAHTAEDLTYLVIKENNFPLPTLHKEVKNGFVLKFEEDPRIDIKRLEKNVKDLISAGLNLKQKNETYITIGERKSLSCTCPRVHVKDTSEIKGFRLLPEIKYDNIMEGYFIIGMVGEKEPNFLEILQ